MSKKVIIGGGGTGGHVFPAISIANALKELDPGTDIMFVGAIGKLEMTKVPEAGYNITGIPVSGFKRKIGPELFKFPFMLLKSMRIAASIVRDFKPDLAIGVGGYASGPILRSAVKRGVPVFIQEQNSYAGVTNKILARSARKIFVAYSGMERFFPAEKIVLTGNPVRKDIINIKVGRAESIRYLGLDENKQTILVLGGSGGAKTINKSIMASAGRLPGNIQVLWQTGKYYYEEAKSSVNSANVVVTAFIDRMDMAYTAADIIITRSGAGTISELAIVGKPVILVPSPNVAEDHQTKNAMALKDKNAALLVADADAERLLMDEAFRLAGDGKLKNALSENIKQFAIPDSATRIAQIILDSVK